jgi:nicotinamidase/pyrazinamidase
MRIACFDVDAQKGFTPICPNDLPVQGGDEIVNALNEQAEVCEIRVGSKDAHTSGALWEATEDKPVFSEVGEVNVDIRWPKHCVMGTEGAELLDGLPKPEDYDFFVWKGIEKNLHPYGACYHDLNEKLSTGVIEFLKSKEIDTVVVGGLATDYCVKTTALQLKRAGFEVIVNLKACRGVAKETTDNAIQEMTDEGIKVVDEFLVKF